MLNVQNNNFGVFQKTTNFSQKILQKLGTHTPTQCVCVLFTENELLGSIWDGNQTLPFSVLRSCPMPVKSPSCTHWRAHPPAPAHKKLFSLPTPHTPHKKEFFLSPYPHPLPKTKLFCPPHLQQSKNTLYFTPTPSRGLCEATTLVGRPLHVSVDGVAKTLFGLILYYYLLFYYFINYFIIIYYCIIVIIFILFFIY